MARIRLGESPCTNGGSGEGAGYLEDGENTTRNAANSLCICDLGFEVLLGLIILNPTKEMDCS